jgi:tetratricopeptide (TPR) repeat protein
VVHARDDPPAATSDAARPRFALGSEVVLKLPGLPIFDQGREVPSGENLTFIVERSEAERLLLVSRDRKTRGWAYEDEVVPFEHATDYVGRAVLNDIRDAESFWVLGRLWFYLNDVDRALVNLNRAIRLPNSQPAFYLSRSLVHMRRSDIRRAWQDCETVLRLEPDRAQGNPVREKAQLAQKAYSHATTALGYVAALAALEEAFRLDPANPYSRGSGPVRAASSWVLTKRIRTPARILPIRSRNVALRLNASPAATSGIPGRNLTRRSMTITPLSSSTRAMRQLTRVAPGPGC